MESQKIELGGGALEDDGHRDVQRGRDSGSQQSASPPDSGQHRPVVKNIKSVIRLLETEILTQFTNHATISPISYF